MSLCRSCGQKIDWIKTERGKNMPVDPDYLHWNDAEDGDVIIDASGHVLTVNSKLSRPNVKGRMSHFATCPQADRWRKSK